MKNILTQFYSPLEQFEIRPLVDLSTNYFDFSITNQTIIGFVIIFFFMFLFDLTRSKNDTYFLIPRRFQAIQEIIFDFLLNLVKDNIKHKDNVKFFPLVFALFIFLSVTNLIGLIPYSFTLTSHIIVTFYLSLGLFIGINIICVQKHGLKFFSLFLPPNTPFILALLLVPIEIISYFFKPISLSIRLFANMMAGHILLKVIAGFIITLLTATSLFVNVLTILPFIILTLLFVLELAVAVIQAFVFTLLICIYINESLNLH